MLNYYVQHPDLLLLSCSSLLDGVGALTCCSYSAAHVKKLIMAPAVENPAAYLLLQAFV